MSITTIPENRLTEEEKAVINYLRALNDTGRNILLTVVESCYKYCIKMGYAKYKEKGKILSFSNKDGES